MGKEKLRIIRSFLEVVDNYDGVILDAYGVLHNGMKAYDHVLETLKILKEKGKKTMILSNSPNRNFKV
jgi:ribonucleotide monophosphatase NagD (HAD superfamily)